MPHFGALIGTAYVLGLSVLAIVMVMRRSSANREVAGGAFPALLDTLGQLRKPS
jgi:hypothetical protein